MPRIFCFYQDNKENTVEFFSIEEAKNYISREYCVQPYQVVLESINGEKSSYVYLKGKLGSTISVIGFIYEVEETNLCSYM